MVFFLYILLRYWDHEEFIILLDEVADRVGCVVQFVATGFSCCNKSAGLLVF